MNKKLLSLYSVIIIYCLLFTTTIYAIQGTVTVDNLNIRSGPGLDYDVIGQLHKNTEVDIIDQTGDWYKITSPQIEGWASTDFVHTTSNSTNGEVYIQVKTHQSSIQVKAEPAFSASVIDQIQSGETYPFIKQENTWYQIQLPSGENGWVASWLVKKYGDTKNESDDNQKELQKDISLLQNKVIVIDAGHGADDTGTISARGDYEKFLTSRTSQILASRLKTLGAVPILTRSDDTFLPLSNRVAYAHAYQADAFISLHYNSAPQFPEVHGLGTFYYYDQYLPLAREIQNEMIKATDLKDRDVRFGDYFVIRENNTPSVLIELGFLSNQREELILKSESFQQQAVTGIIRGLINYYEEDQEI